MADTVGYHREQNALRSLLRLHHSSPCPPSPIATASPRLSTGTDAGASSTGTSGGSVAVRLQDLVAARHLNRLRHKQVRPL